jgi:hypothetical protein
MEVAKMRAAYGRLKMADLQSAFKRAKDHFPTLRVPSKLELFWAKWSPLLAHKNVYTRTDLADFWRNVKLRAAEKSWLRIPVYKVPLNLLRDFQLSVLFFLSLARAK